MTKEIYKFAGALVVTLSATVTQAEDAIEQVDQAALNALVAAGDMQAAFNEAFDLGDELTEHSFTRDAGVGANIGEGRLFSRFPRADLDGPGEWATHFPVREGGANATSCIACHNAPMANGAGDIAVNVLVDPAHTGDPALFLERNTLPLFALAVPQLLAEEMSQDLMVARYDALTMACADGAAEAALEANGVDFGQISVIRTNAEPCMTEIDYSGLNGVDEDLIIRPFGWKGNHSTIRAFTRNAAHNELGLQAVELVGFQDGDYDGVTGELSVGDMTALTLYMAGLERPVTTLELAEIGLVELGEGQAEQINWGETVFADVGCASCHVPEMIIETPIFSEPSATHGFFDARFPDGSDPVMHGLAIAEAVQFDLTTDQPNNRFEVEGVTHHLGALPVAENGGAIAAWFTDFRRHDMGPDLSDPADPLGIGASVFLTRSLAGVGSTGPWLHDGRATTLNEAILAHGGAAADVRDAYAARDAEDQAALVAFLENLVIYAPEEEEH